jgi:mannitol/fructose-specific phosphotransferase system IIA component (Ntr-type)
LKDGVPKKCKSIKIESQLGTRLQAEFYVLAGNAPERFFRLVSERERVSSSGWRFGVAVPYARVNGLLHPLVAIGRTDKGVDFGSRDGRPAKLIVLILTPDNQSQHDLLADAGRLFSQKEMVDRALAANSFVEGIHSLTMPLRRRPELSPDTRHQSPQP